MRLNVIRFPEFQCRIFLEIMKRRHIISRFLALCAGVFGVKSAATAHPIDQGCTVRVHFTNGISIPLTNVVQIRTFDIEGRSRWIFRRAHPHKERWFFTDTVTMITDEGNGLLQALP